MADPNLISHPVMQRVRRALGRTAPMTSAPIPPSLDEPIIRLVHSDIGLPELFQKQATDMKMLVEMMRVDEVIERVAQFLISQKCKSAMLSDTPLLRNLGALEALQKAGIDACGWSQMTADEAYDIEAGVTEADYAVAETGTLVIRHRPEHGRLLSLVPFVHVAIIEPRIIVPDLLDLFERLAGDGTGSGVTLISGPSKTADIEMNTVTGVHGPNVVKAFVLS